MAGVSIDFDNGTEANAPVEFHGPSPKKRPRYLQLTPADRIGVEGLNGFCHAAGAHDRAARKLANFAAFEALFTSIPLAIADFAAMWAVLSASLSIAESFVAVPAAFAGHQAVLLASLLLIPIAELTGLYPGIAINSVVEFRHLIRASFLSLLGFAIIGSVLIPDSWLYFNVAAVLAFALCIPIFPVVRYLARKLLSKIPGWGASVLIYAEPAAAAEMLTRLRNMPERGLRPAGLLLRPEHYWLNPRTLTDPNLPTFDARDAVNCAVKLRATWVMVGTYGAPGKSADRAIDASLCVIPNRVVLSTAGLEFGIWDHARAIGSACGIRLSGGRPNMFYGVLKRATDLAVAGLMSVLLLPFLVLTSLLIRFSSPGPVLYGQERIGLGGRRFKAWKFRTMRTDADQVLSSYLQNHPELRAEWDATRKLKNDPRVTAIGRFLRKTSLDELPQLWNILRGDMSLVGPRPIIDSPTYDGAYVLDYPEEFSAYKTMRPGLTGLWQVTCRNSSVYEMRIFWDVYYIRNWSPWLDLHILLRTVRTVVLREGAY